MLNYSKNYQVNSSVNHFFMRVSNNSTKYIFNLKMINASLLTVVLVTYVYLGVSNWTKWFGNLGENSILGIVLFFLIGSKFFSIFNLLITRFPHLKKTLLFLTFSPILVVAAPLPFYGSFTFYYIYIIWALSLIIEASIFFLVYGRYKKLYIAFLTKMKPWAILKLIFSLFLLSTTFSQVVFLSVLRVPVEYLIDNVPVILSFILIIIFFLIILIVSSCYYIAFFRYWKLLYPGGIVRFQPMVYMSFIRIGILYFLIAIQYIVSGTFNVIHIASTAVGGTIGIIHFFTIKRFKKNSTSSIMITLINMGFVAAITVSSVASVFLSYLLGGPLISALNLLPLASPFIIWGISNATEVKKRIIFSDTIAWIFTSLSYLFLMFILFLLNTTSGNGGDIGDILSSSASEYTIRLMITITGVGIFVIAGHAGDLSIRILVHSRRLKRIGD